MDKPYHIPCLNLRGVVESASSSDTTSIKQAQNRGFSLASSTHSEKDFSSVSPPPSNFSLKKISRGERCRPSDASMGTLREVLSTLSKAQQAAVKSRHLVPPHHFSYKTQFSTLVQLRSFNKSVELTQNRDTIVPQETEDKNAPHTCFSKGPYFCFKHQLGDSCLVSCHSCRSDEPLNECYAEKSVQTLVKCAPSNAVDSFSQEEDRKADSTDSPSILDSFSYSTRTGGLSTYPCGGEPPLRGVNVSAIIRAIEVVKSLLEEWDAFESEVEYF